MASTSGSTYLKNITVIGGSGNVGRPIIAALLTSDIVFAITVLTRSDSTAVFEPEVTVKKTDFSSHTTLVDNLRGQDVLICTLNDYSTVVQLPLINAAYDAGVRRIIPSEFASNEWEAIVPELGEVGETKYAVIDLLQQKAKEAGETGKEFHWTAINNGLLFDWGLRTKFLDICLPPVATATIWDNGSNIFSATNLSTIAVAVVKILGNSEIEKQTRDRYVNIQSFAVSQNKIVAALEETAGQKWNREKTTTVEQLATARESFDNGDFESAFSRWVRGTVFSGKSGCRFEGSLDNDLLGLPVESLEESVARVLAST